MPQIENGVLDLSGKNLTDITGLQTIDHINQVHKLKLFNNQLKTLPAGGFNGLYNLQYLQMSYNQLQTLPKTIFNGLYNLRVLTLAHNQLKMLPDTIFDDLHNLVWLRLDNNQLQELPDDIFFYLPNLQKLLLNNNQLKMPSFTIFKYLNNLQFLDLKNNLFDSNLIPPITDIKHTISRSLTKYIEHYGMPHIEYGISLDLSHKNLTDLNGLRTIPGIDQVKILKLSNNQLKTLPDSLFNGLFNLTDLDLSNNQLRTLPDTIFNNLPNLQYLYLENNQLHTLPDTVFHGLHNLRVLYLSNNQLPILPKTLFNGMNRLVVLTLKGNRFSLDFIPTLTNMISTIAHLQLLDGQSKDRTLKQVPFSTLKQLTAEYLLKNLESEQYKQLEPHILDLLPLNEKEREELEKNRISQ